MSGVPASGEARIVWARPRAYGAALDSPDLCTSDRWQLTAEVIAEGREELACAREGPAGHGRPDQPLWEAEASSKLRSLPLELVQGALMPLVALDRDVTVDGLVEVAVETSQSCRKF